MVVSKKGLPAYGSSTLAVNHTFHRVWSDRRFTGFGWNKVSHIMELHRAGYKCTYPFTHQC